MTETKTNLERKIDLLIGCVQDLKEKVEGYSGRKRPSHKWLSSKELSLHLGLSQRSLLNMVHAGKFPEEFIRRQKRGEYEIFKFDSEKIISFAENDLFEKLQLNSSIDYL